MEGRPAQDKRKAVVRHARLDNNHETQYEMYVYEGDDVYHANEKGVVVSIGNQTFRLYPWHNVEYIEGISPARDSFLAF